MFEYIYNICFIVLFLLIQHHNHRSGVDYYGVYFLKYGPQFLCFFSCMVTFKHILITIISFWTCVGFALYFEKKMWKTQVLPKLYWLGESQPSYCVCHANLGKAWFLLSLRVCFILIRIELFLRLGVLLLELPGVLLKC